MFIQRIAITRDLVIASPLIMIVKHKRDYVIDVVDKPVVQIADNETVKFAVQYRKLANLLRSRRTHSPMAVEQSI